MMRSLGLLIFLLGQVAFGDILAEKGVPSPRRLLRGQLTADIHPVSNVVVPSYGFTLGTYINNSHMLELHYAKGSVGIDTVLVQSGVTRKLRLQEAEKEMEGELAGVYQDINRTDITHELIALQHRYFWTPIFYTLAGLGLKRYAIEYPVSEISKYDDLTASLFVSKPSLTFGVGHRWILGSLLVGMEWFHATLPFSRFEKSDSTLKDQSLVRKYEDFTSKVIYTFCSLSVGILF